MTHGIRPEDITHAKATLAKKQKVQDPDAISFDLSFRPSDDTSIEMKQASSNSIITTSEFDCSSESRGEDTHEPQDPGKNWKGTPSIGDTRSKHQDASDRV